MGVSFHSEVVPSNNSTRKGSYNMLNVLQPVHRLVVRGPLAGEVTTLNIQVCLPLWRDRLETRRVRDKYPSHLSGYLESRTIPFRARDNERKRPSTKE